MPRWFNKPLTAYHGSDTHSLAAYRPLVLNAVLTSFGINIARCRPNTDFGQGFYLTSYLHQARQWANNGVNRNEARKILNSQAIVLRFTVDRDLLAGADALAFVLATNDYWDLVADCRNGFPPHYRNPAKPEYDVVYGPVSLWRQQLIVHDSDQLSVHTQAVANQLPPPVVHDIATGPRGRF